MQATSLLSLQKHFSQVIQSEEEDPNECVAVYQNAYFMRILESMEEDFPKAREILGDEPFSQLVREFLREIPSKYWTLAQVGERLPEFVLSSRWNAECPSLLNTVRLEWLAILADMSLNDAVFNFSILANMTPEQQQEVILCLGRSAGIEPLELSETQWHLLTKISQKVSIGDLVTELSDLDPADVTQLFSEWVSMGVIARWTE